MAKSVKVTFRGYVPQAGRAQDLSGTPSNKKQLVIAQVELTASSGETDGIIPFVARDLGLGSVDFINLNVIARSGVSTTSTDKTLTTGVKADYDEVAPKIIVRHIPATTTAFIAVSSTNLVGTKVQVVAIGDSLAAPDLLP
jgi:hypothetical protein